jgi:copper homeostasis protein (lipoprotein)
MRRLIGALGFAAAIAVAGCSTAAPHARRAPAPEPLVLRFSGTLPCADCPGIATTLTLTRKAAGWAEGTYRLEQTYIGRGGPRVTTGDWTTLRGDATDDNATVYELDPDKTQGAQHFLRVGDDVALRLLDGDMKPLPGKLPNTLKRVK